MNKKDKAAAAESKPTFEKAELTTHSQRLFSQPPEVVAGALYDVKEAITIEQARDKVKGFLTRPISTEGGK